MQNLDGRARWHGTLVCEQNEMPCVGSARPIGIGILADRSSVKIRSPNIDRNARDGSFTQTKNRTRAVDTGALAVRGRPGTRVRNEGSRDGILVRDGPRAPRWWAWETGRENKQGERAG